MTPHYNPIKKPLFTTESFCLALAIAVAIAILTWVLIHIPNGFDFTDDAFYLVWISNPWLYEFSPSQFGFIYHPLYELVNGDLSLLRQINALITIGLTWVVFGILLKTTFIEKENSESGILNILWISAVSFAASVTCLVFFNFWLPSPSYNSLALQALLVASIGILLADKDFSYSSSSGWIFIGVAGWLAFMAKPTTAAALAPVVGGYLLLSGKMNLRLLAISLGVAIGLGLLSAWLIDSSINGFLRRLLAGAESGRILTDSYSLSNMLRVDSFTWSGSEKQLLLVGVFLTFISTCFMVSNKRHASAALLFSICIAGTAIIAAAPYVRHTHFETLLLCAGPLGGLLALVVLSRKKAITLFSRSSLLLPICFSVFPFVYAFGTGNNYWMAAGLAGVFWVLASVSIIGSVDVGRDKWKFVFPILLVSQVATALLLYSGMESPYRQTQPIRLQSSHVEINHQGNSILVPPDFAIYIKSLQKILASHGFKNGDPMIDLTGHYPGSLYAVGARAIGSPWAIGGYSGSDAFAIAALRRVSCIDIATAWILTEPDGPRHLSSSVLDKLGMNHERDYMQIGELLSPTGSYKTPFKQRVLKPIRTRDNAQAACQSQKDIAQ